jgi:tRNA(Ile)-lysidine synthase
MEGLSNKKKYLVGVSGGRDSMVLLDTLKRLGFKRLVVCHLDHTLRGRASREDLVFVRRQAKAFGCELESARSRTAEFAAEQKKSLELAARELRQAFFAKCAKIHNCRDLILAHHADDQIETCLFNFLRGTGASGLAGMKPVSKLGSLTVHRPLLGVERREIDLYQKLHRIRFREDASNAESLHARNKLRLSVIPAIERALGSGFRKAIPRAAEILRAEDEWMSSFVPETAENLTCRNLRAMPLALQRRTVHRWLKSCGVSECGWEETRRVLSLLDTTGPAKTNLPGGLYARRREGILFLEKGTE